MKKSSPRKPSSKGAKLLTLEELENATSAVTRLPLPTGLEAAKNAAALMKQLERHLNVLRKDKSKDVSADLLRLTFILTGLCQAERVALEMEHQPAKPWKPANPDDPFEEEEDDDM